MQNKQRRNKKSRKKKKEIMQEKGIPINFDMQWEGTVEERVNFYLAIYTNKFVKIIESNYTGKNINKEIYKKIIEEAGNLIIKITEKCYKNNRKKKMKKTEEEKKKRRKKKEKKEHKKQKK